MTGPVCEEFEIEGDVVRHAPTGYAMKFHSGSRDIGIAEIGQLGRPLPDGRNYEPEDIRQMVRDLRKTQLAQRMFFPEEGGDNP